VDYYSVNAFADFAAGTSEIKIKIDPIDDSASEGPETVVLTLASDPSYALHTTLNKATLLLEDNDASPLAVYGDVSGEGTISALDAALILQHVAGSITLNAAKIAAGDVSGDGSLSGYDASLVLQYVLGKIVCFPVEGSCSVAKG
jgi:hypothetical protein